MTTREHHSNMEYNKLYDPALVAPTIDIDSASVDTQGFDSLSLVVNIGESGDTLSGSVYIEVEVEESVDDSVWTDVADADLTNFVAGTNDGTIAKIDAAAEDDVVVTTGYTGSKRYVRVVINVTGTHTNGFPWAATAINGHPHQSPVNAAT